MVHRMRGFSKQTMQRWWLVIGLTVIGLMVLASSVYFLFFPLGFQGGRNPYYSTVILFSRESWDLIHLWAGLAMIVFVVIHVFVHRKWIDAMISRSLSMGTARMNSPARINVITDLIAALSFILAAASGIYFLFVPNRSLATSAPKFIFSYSQWDVIHTWSGIVMIIAVFIHFAIHWIWIRKVTGLVMANRMVLVKTVKISEKQGVENA